ncbi:hypothetical protein N7520_009837 [Penicillium odoratum]|uniref:uncharacterized protein n=1 Tax=Penicillium odoratum TaxID=1167516 RepID=UPI002547483D|nr:uncharacterized protein N7520_009837 [Penicillium odoratum]KAJ5752920.1 hypothetical protein N7520_009837 [Penicillium odoratum]
MHVFVTGATGFVGQAVVQELLDAGHTVTGLARSEASASALQQKGAAVVHGSLGDIDCLKNAAFKADGVIHLAFDHDFSKFAENAKAERTALFAMIDALAGSNKPLVFTSGTMSLVKGEMGTENSTPEINTPFSARTVTEQEALDLSTKGVRVSCVRLSVTTHGEGDKGFVWQIADFARANGQSVYVGNGLNRWPAVHRRDAASLFRLALEKGAAGKRYHAVAEEGIPMKDIAEAIGKSTGLPTVSQDFEAASKHFAGFLVYPVSADNPASSKKTREQLGWSPSEPSLLADIEAGAYN